ncbi:MAG: tRNA uridine-5-carboxymethylaminomethyl(34) synthesis GTPase MnmE [Paracoccus sp. (in: a-proteobacteria)]|nr:tRNA uridine-5-carboxymethylaminomethyl(34) synthesis GTPase MnmE [Paracoccus sp. (in: a-proteobacteria)]
MDTIFAEATPPGRGGVSVVRLSGPGSRHIAEELAGPLDEARRSCLRAFRDGEDLIDRGLVIRFDPGASFTGEESVEFHLHGAPVVVRRLEAALASRGARRAEAGEFTMRSFLSGRMDLAEVEGLSDLLAAETEAQRKLAVETSSGALGRLAEEWREDLIGAGAMITASIDFADEEIPDDVADGVAAVIEQVRASIAAQVAGYPANERLRNGFEVALIGAPNAGKSSLMNAIARRDIAIVTDLPGTTRDIVEFRADLRGLPVSFLDTAGIRETADQIEGIGIGRAIERAFAADLRVFLGAVPEGAEVLIREGDLFITTRGDLSGDPAAISAVTGAGIDQLMDQIFDILRERLAAAGLASHARQAEALMAAEAALRGAGELPPELMAESLRTAQHHLQRLVGRIDVDDYLDRVFSTFCVGK